MDQDPVIITPWAEYMIATRHFSGGSRGSQNVRPTTTQASGGIDWESFLELAPETEELKRIITCDKNGHVLRVNNERDLEELTELLLSKPLLMRVTLVHTEVASKYTADTVSIWEGDYAVVLNTSHQKIRSQLKNALWEARGYVTNRWRFCLEVDLSDVIEAWYLQTIDVYSGCDDFQTTKCRKSRIYVTNYKTYNHCFDCAPRWWFCLSLCWLLSAPCYMGYRHATCKDIQLKLEGKVKPIKCIRRASTTSDVKSKSSSIVNFRMEDDRTTTSALKGHFRPEDMSTYGAL